MRRKETATFAGGCFWCLVPPFNLPGVIKIAAGYTGGDTENPTYKEVCSNKTGHVEAVNIIFDPEIISYEDLLDIFWHQIDPTDSGGQFADRGDSYKTFIFYHNEEQRRVAERSKAALADSGKFRKAIATEIVEAKKFYPAEEYHQEYYKKNPDHYALYSEGSGRKAFIRENWNDSDKFNDRKMQLNQIQLAVTQENGTEPPFQNEYWDKKDAGIYVDIVSGEPLFSSLDKFDSGCGWPSFKKPLERDNIYEKPDYGLGMVRVEVRSKEGDSHLGHLFDDGPPPVGLRYCINSAALRFIPVEKLAKEGYGEYLTLFG